MRGKPCLESHDDYDDEEEGEGENMMKGKDWSAIEC